MPTNDTWDKIDTLVEENHQKNAKYSHGKIKQSYSFVPGSALLAVAQVMEGGAKKYGAYNWRDNGVDATTYFDAIMRHLIAWYHDSDDADHESGSHPLAHVMACCALVLDTFNEGKLHDNRPRNHKHDQELRDTPARETATQSRLLDVYALKDRVVVRTFTPVGVVEQEGTVVARTTEENPRYDIALPDGKIVANINGEALLKV
jgi:hypothetical protein